MLDKLISGASLSQEYWASDVIRIIDEDFSIHTAPNFLKGGRCSGWIEAADDKWGSHYLCPRKI